MEANAYSELLEVYRRCDAHDCLCSDGRAHSAKTGYDFRLGLTHSDTVTSTDTYDVKTLALAEQSRTEQNRSSAASPAETYYTRDVFYIIS